MGLPIPAEEKQRLEKVAREDPSSQRRRQVVAASNAAKQSGRLVYVDVPAKARGMLYQPCSISDIAYRLIKTVSVRQNDTVRWCFDGPFQEMPHCRARCYQKRYKASPRQLEKHRDAIARGEMVEIDGKLRRSTMVPLEESFVQDTGFDQNSCLDATMWSRFLDGKLKPLFWQMLAEAVVKAAIECTVPHTAIVDPPTARDGALPIKISRVGKSVEVATEPKPSYFAEADLKIAFSGVVDATRMVKEQTAPDFGPRKPLPHELHFYSVDYDLLAQLVLALPVHLGMRAIIHYPKKEPIDVGDYRRVHGRAFHSFLMLSCGSDYHDSLARFGIKPVSKEWDFLCRTGKGPVGISKHEFWVLPRALMESISQMINKRSRRGKPTGDELHLQLVRLLWVMYYWLMPNHKPEEGVAEPHSPDLDGLRLYPEGITLDLALSGRVSPEGPIVIGTSPFAV